MICKKTEHINHRRNRVPSQKSGILNPLVLSATVRLQRNAAVAFDVKQSIEAKASLVKLTS